MFLSLPVSLLLSLKQKTECFPPQSHNQEPGKDPTPIQHHTGSPGQCNKARERNKRRNTVKEEIKLSPSWGINSEAPRTNEWAYYNYRNKDDALKSVVFPRTSNEWRTMHILQCSQWSIHLVPGQAHRQSQRCAWYPARAVQTVPAWSYARCRSADTGRCSPSCGPHCPRSEPGSGWSLRPHQSPSSLGGKQRSYNLMPVTPWAIEILIQATQGRRHCCWLLKDNSLL